MDLSFDVTADSSLGLKVVDGLWHIAHIFDVMINRSLFPQGGYVFIGDSLFVDARIS